MKNPIIVAMNTRTDRSLFLIVPITPVKNANIPEIPAISIGIDSARLLKNVAPPRCPEATRSWNVMNNTTKAIMSQIDHLPKRVLGTKGSFIG
jgi:hypothetical protein